MKPATVLVSLIAALAPLTSACGDAPVAAEAPAEALIMSGGEGTSTDALALKAPPPVEDSAKKARVFPINAHPFGKSYEEWVEAWYDWALGVPVSQNPILGGPCEVDQSGKVFFLAGNTGGTAVRPCTIPKGKGIFIPIVNTVCFSCPELVDEFYTCDVALSEEDAHTSATMSMDIAEIDMVLEVDGVSVGGLENYRAHSDTFLNDTSPASWSDRIWPTCSGPIRENSCGIPVGSTRIAAADGFWVMLKPLHPGEHQVHFAANVVRPGRPPFALDITYNITVTN